MAEHPDQALFWAPRVLSVLFIAFVSMFALDVFSEGRGFRQTMAALMMHSIPSIVMVVALVAAWRREWVGAIAFTLITVSFTVITRGTGAKVLFDVPCLATAWLFFVNWHYKRTHMGSAH